MIRPSIFRSNRIAACAMGFMVLFAVLFSALFITLEADHDCSGEDCPICVCIAECENTLHQVGEGSAPQMALTFPVLLLFLSVCSFASFIALRTPVSGKVRLNN